MKLKQILNKNMKLRNEQERLSSNSENEMDKPIQKRSLPFIKSSIQN